MAGVFRRLAGHMGSIGPAFDLAKTGVRAAVRGRKPDGLARIKAPWHPPAARLVAGLAALAMATTLVCAGLAYQTVRQSDARHAAAQRATLRDAIAEFSALFDARGKVDPRFVRMVEQATGLKDLKFTADPDAAVRAVQPVIDAQGRIVGFFTFAPDHPLTQAMRPLIPVFAVMVVCLAAFAGIALRQLRHARRELSASEERARRADDEDRLTGLPTQAKLLALTGRALTERAGGQATTLALVQLDGMDDMNAQLGVAGSEQLIVALAGRLKEAMLADAVIGRVSGDKFAVTFTADADVDAEAILRAAVDAVARAHWMDAVVRVSARAGFAQAPQHASSSAELMQRAELALRGAVQKGAAAVVPFTREIDMQWDDAQFIRRELPRVLSAHELELYYQPIVATHGGRIVGVEALLRWNHAARGPIPPATFIPIAEQMGLMDMLGAFVLRRALTEAKRWPDLYVAVNLSPSQLREPAIVDAVRAALQQANVKPVRLLLEVTEGVLIDDPDAMVERIAELHALGVRVALDDFGTGYSNLGYLQRFAFDKLKIDKSLVSGLGHSANGAAIIQAIVALGRALGVSVLIEGVETEEQRVLLRLAGCDEMQGFLFGKPAPAQMIERLVKQPKSAAVPVAAAKRRVA